MKKKVLLLVLIFGAAGFYESRPSGLGSSHAASH